MGTDSPGSSERNEVGVFFFQESWGGRTKGGGGVGGCGGGTEVEPDGSDGCRCKRPAVARVSWVPTVAFGCELTDKGERS
jgi:hypothetical protein